jgi:hypothetical protein
VTTDILECSFIPLGGKAMSRDVLVHMLWRQCQVYSLGIALSLTEGSWNPRGARHHVSWTQVSYHYCGQALLLMFGTF